MKKILCAILSLVMMLSVMTTAAIGVCAEETTDFVGKSSLKFNMPAALAWQTNTNQYANISSGNIGADEACTVTFYVRVDGARIVGTGTTWSYGFIIGLGWGSATGENVPNDFIGMNGPTTNLYVAGTAYPEYQFKSGEWNRIDILLDRNDAEGDNGEYTVYFNCQEVCTIAATKKVPINGLWMKRLSNNQAEQTNYVDNVLIRKGLYVPSENDVYASCDEARIAQLDGFFAYESFDSMPSLTKFTTESGAKSIAYGTGVDARNIRMLGHQRSLVADTTMDLRFVGVVDDISGYTRMGLNIAATGKVAEDFDVNNVWTGVQGTDEDGTTVMYSASNYGYSYVFVADLTGIPTTLGVLEFTVTPYAYDADGERIDFEPITVKYDGANVQ